jgi:tryptophan synthase alpha chain
MKKYNGIYLVGNYPDKETFIKGALKAFEFFDFLEVGIPFSDPLADGPVIVEAAGKALKNGETILTIMESIDTIRKSAPEGKKIYLMNYANTAHAPGFGPFCDLLKAHGVSGMIIPDIPFKESASIKVEAHRCGLEYVDFITPESRKDQIEKICAGSNGFIYAVSSRGITGQDVLLGDDIKNNISIAKEGSDNPVVMGFGIKNSALAKEALESADGFIMGTEAVRRIGLSFEEFSGLIDELKTNL